MHSQMLKGVLEGCILYIISQEEVYGYELSTKLNKHGFTFVAKEASIRYYYVCKKKIDRRHIKSFLTRSKAKILSHNR